MADAEIKQTKGECPQCEGSRNAEIKAEFYEGWSDDDDGIDGGIHFRILKCLGCDAAYVQKETWFSEDVDYRYDPRTGEHEPYMPTVKDHWPKSHSRKRPTWRLKIHATDPQLASLLEEVYTAYDNELFVLSAIGVRTAFDRASEVLGIDAELSFAKKLSELVATGNIGTSEKAILEVLTDAGSAAAHRAWRPKREELDVMLDAIEGFLNRSFVVSGEASKLLSVVPSRPKKAPKPKKAP